MESLGVSTALDLSAGGMGRPLSMMDVLLLALLVTLVKLGDIVTFQLGPAVLAFVMCVFMSMIASIAFDPHAIWEESPGES